MDKGDFSIGKLGAIMLILVVVIIVIAVVPGKIWAGAKSLLGFGQLEIPIQELDEQAYDGFGRLVQDIVACRKFQQDDCGCKVDLSFFGQTHALIAKDDRIEMRNVRGKADTLMASSDRLKERGQLKQLNCYYDSNAKHVQSELQSELQIRFDAAGGYFYRESSLFEDVGLTNDRKERSVDSGRVYKKGGEICFLAEGEKASLKSCEQKPLTS